MARDSRAFFIDRIDCSTPHAINDFISQKHLPMARGMESATPKRYLVYFEVAGHQNKVRDIIEAYRDDEDRARMQALPHGYLVELPVQTIPDPSENRLKTSL